MSTFLGYAVACWLLVTSATFFVQTTRLNRLSHMVFTLARATESMTASLSALVHLHRRLAEREERNRPQQ